MRILVTRPEPDNQRTASALRSMGHLPVLAPLLQIETVEDADFGPPPWSGVLLTSANAVRAVVGHPRFYEIIALPVLTVGAGTAEAAREAGFTDVTSADGDAHDLVLLAIERFAKATAPLLYLAGEHRSMDLAAELATRGGSARTVAIYRAIKAPSFPDATRTMLANGEIEGVLHFSRRSAENYLACGKLAMKQALSPVHYCLSERAAEPLRSGGAAQIRVAARPDEESLLALLIAHKPSR